ncbi:hypothetical protein H6G93_33870 [Nostoc sp. FACHB-973]|nr:hypothetical protein [Nostoc sp. FACHB-973]
MEEAASVGVTYVTAWLCVMEVAQAQAGETLLVIGATGGVGSTATQIAKWKGLRYWEQYDGIAIATQCSNRESML